MEKLTKRRKKKTLYSFVTIDSKVMDFFQSTEKSCHVTNPQSHVTQSTDFVTTDKVTNRPIVTGLDGCSKKGSITCTKDCEPIACANDFKPIIRANDCKPIEGSKYVKLVSLEDKATRASGDHGKEGNKNVLETLSMPSVRTKTHSSYNCKNPVESYQNGLCVKFNPCVRESTLLDLSLDGYYKTSPSRIANLRSAHLKSANVRSANLKSANVRSANVIAPEKRITSPKKKRLFKTYDPFYEKYRRHNTPHTADDR